MGFKSVLGKIGKIALKAAPIAASFIPGVGPLAGMAIGAASGAADKKLSGGSWKQALGAGAMGAGTSALGSAMSGQLSKGAGGLKNLGKMNIAKTPMTGMQQVARGVTAGLGGLNAVSDVMAQSQNQGQGIGPSQSMGMQYGQGFGQRRGAMQGMNRMYGNGLNQQNPFFNAIQSGRNVALQNQPFRAGQSPFTRTNPDTGAVEDMPGGGLPPISPQFGQPGMGFNPSMFGAVGNMGLQPMYNKSFMGKVGQGPQVRGLSFNEGIGPQRQTINPNAPGYDPGVVGPMRGSFNELQGQYPQLQQYRDQGMQVGQDMNWMDQPGALEMPGIGPSIQKTTDGGLKTAQYQPPQQMPQADMRLFNPRMFMQNRNSPMGMM